LRKLRDRLQYEENNYFFICNSCSQTNIKYKFDEAFDLNFKCPECGGPLGAQDNEQIKHFLKEKIVVNERSKIIIDPED
jgi:transcription initiation factor TFIIE subunit alpha